LHNTRKTFANTVKYRKCKLLNHKTHISLILHFIDHTFKFVKLHITTILHTSGKNPFAVSHACRMPLAAWSTQAARCCSTMHTTHSNYTGCAKHTYNIIRWIKLFTDIYHYTNTEPTL